MAVGCVSAVAIVVGLGLGLGLKSSSSESTTILTTITTEATMSSTTIVSTPITTGSIRESSPPEATKSSTFTTSTETAAPGTTNTVPPPSECYRGLQFEANKHLPLGTWSKTCPSKAPSCTGERSVLLISLDGFRADYLLRNHTPTLSAVKSCGVHASFMRPAFPTDTFVNHYTIATGLYPESHGIVADTMYDMETEEVFTLSGDNKFHSHWWHGEPIWNTVKKNGGKVVTFFWPGAEVIIQDMRPDHCYYYNSSISYTDRVNEVLGYYSDPTDLPQLVALYMEQPTWSGSGQGPYGDWVHGNLSVVDQHIDQLLAGLEQRNLLGCVDIIITADHGMQGTNCGRRVVLYDYLTDGELGDIYIHEGMCGRISPQYIYDSALGMKPNPNAPAPQEVLDKLKCENDTESKDWNTVIDLKQDLPKRLHHSNHPRIDDIILNPSDSWTVFRKYSGSWQCSKGDHGGDNIHESMNAIFLGVGPQFKEDTVVEGFDNTELYNLIADLLNLSSVAPNNGTLGRTNEFLVNPPTPSVPSPPRGMYREWAFPDTEEAERRRNLIHSCTCSDLTTHTSHTVEDLDLQLNLDSSAVTSSQTLHLPYGVPEVDFADPSLQLLTSTRYVSAYSAAYRMPLWTAFKMTHVPGAVSVVDSVYRTDGGVPDDCVRPDVRLNPDNLIECGSYSNVTEKITWAKLYPTDSQNTVEDQLDAHVSTNLVPMYDGFKNGVWSLTMRLLDEYTEKYGDLRVTLGPVFDYNADGHRDTPTDIPLFVGGGTVPVPTHYFVTASRCGATPGCTAPQRVVSLLLPHKHTPTNCWDRRYDRYQAYHVARIRDIELLTDLRFHGDVSLEERLTLSTRLTVGLWERLGWSDAFGAEGSCPDLETVDCPADYTDPPVLLISLDGFRADYIERGVTPTLSRLHRCGVRAPHMRSIYPSMTFPNHYTQVTGLYPEAHGIVDNNMYDKALGQNFYLGSPNALNSDWWRGEPIWNTVELQNKTSMSMFWVGSDVMIDGTRPTDWYLYNGLYPYEVRVDTVLGWLKGSKGVKPNFISLYFSRIDSDGHTFGPETMEVNYAMQVVDVQIKQLMDGLYKQKLHKCINIIIVSDHGMSDISCERSVVAKELLPEESLDNIYVYVGPSARISNEYRRSGNSYFNINEPDQNDAVRPAVFSDDSEVIVVPGIKLLKLYSWSGTQSELISDLMCQTPHMYVYNKTTLPVRHHYKDHARIDPIINRMDDRWGLDRFSSWCGMIGNHGWDPSFDTMKAFFTGYGPLLKSNTDIEVFENIELYNFMANLLRVVPAPNNGTEGSLYGAMRLPPALPPSAASRAYTASPYPTTDPAYTERANLTAAGCTCNLPENKTAEWDARLEMTPDEMDSHASTHAPYGDIRFADDLTLCKLHHEAYVSGYSAELKQPLWSAYTLAADELPASVTLTSQPDCLRPDVRLEHNDQPLCDDYSVSDHLMPGFLHPADFTADVTVQEDSHVLTNSVPMYTNFWTGIWQDMLLAMVDWTRAFGKVHVITGPIFDYDENGRRDTNTSLVEYMNGRVPIPSHFYAVALHCNGRDNCTELFDYTVQSFVVVHQNNITNCMDADQYLTDNVARLRDVELLTDLEFFTKPDNTTTAQGLSARLFYPVSLWPRT